MSSEGRGETVTTVTREGMSSEGRGETVTTGGEESGAKAVNRQ